MVVNDFEDDYKSDECDEHTATELFYKAAFNEQSILVSCEEYVKLRKSFTGAEEGEPAAIYVGNAVSEKIELCLDKPGAPVPVIEAPGGGDNNASSQDVESNRIGSDCEGIATKLLPSDVQLRKKTRATKKPSTNVNSPADRSSKRRGADESDGSDDINANIKSKRKKAKNSLSSKLKNDRGKNAAGKPVQRTPSVTVDDKAEPSDTESTALPTLTPELSSDDEISLSDQDGIELNVVSFGRGIPDKVTMRKKVSPEEHKRLWHVDIDDKFRHLRRNRYHTAKECRNCRQSGHLTHECVLPEKIVCILCAETTHVAARCPTKICSTCKNEGHTAWRCFRMQQLIEIKCRICSVYGHRADMCPDNWRRYHCTTVEGPPVAPKELEEEQPRGRKFCSWCGRQGHFAFECQIAGNAGIASRFVHSYREPSMKSPRTVEKKKTKKQRAADANERTHRAEQGRAAVFGRDFVPLASTSKKFRNNPSCRGTKKSKKVKGERSNSSTVIDGTSEGEKRGRKRKVDDDERGIDMLPSVLRGKRRKAARQGTSDEKPVNRRKERRKLKRMQNRTERDRVKKKKSKV